MSVIQKMRTFILQLDLKMAVKIALTAIVSFYLCAELDLYIKHPESVVGGLWCVMASIIVFQSNLGGTYKAVWNRFLGVLIGSILGAFFTARFGADLEVLGVAIFTTIALCGLLRLQDSYRIASLSVAIVLIPWKFNPVLDPWTIAFFRFLDTCLGFAVAVVMSNLLWPSQALTKMRLNIAETFNLSRQFYEHLLVPIDSPHKSANISSSLLAEIHDSILQSRSVWEESRMELMMKVDSINQWTELISYQERLQDSLQALQNVFNLTLEEMFDERLKQQTQYTIEVIDFSLKELALKLKTSQTSFDFNLLENAQDSIYQELLRFRNTHTTKKYSLDIIEEYFVFFYQLKQLIKILQESNRLIDSLQGEEQTPALETI
jgi:uncharacterized membrane protein YccC